MYSNFLTNKVFIWIIQIQKFQLEAKNGQSKFVCLFSFYAILINVLIDC